MESPFWPTAAAAALLVAVHVLIGRMHFLAGVPRARWLSFAGGVAVAYVFAHMLPDLAEHNHALQSSGPLAGGLRLDLYLVALLGLAAFYGLERHIRRARGRDPKDDRRSGDRPDEPSAADFWLHAGAFAVYNLLIGYMLLERADEGLRPLAAYTIAMALHFVTSDFGLREDYASAYDATARWLFSAAVGAGALVHAVIEVPPLAVGTMFAFLAGGVVLNVMKEELPDDRQSRLLPFLFGALGYALLLAVLR